MRYLFSLLLFFGHPSLAELPPLAPEEKAKFEQENARQKAMLERQEQALAEAQRRIARQYRDGPPPRIEEGIGKGDVPKSAQLPPRTKAAPHTGRNPANPQAEAHSQSSN